MPAPWSELISQQKLPTAFEESGKDQSRQEMQSDFQPGHERDNDSSSQHTGGASSPRSSAYLTPAASTPTMRNEEEEEEEETEETEEEEGSITPTGVGLRPKVAAYPDAFKAPSLAPVPQSLQQALMSKEAQQKLQQQQQQQQQDESNESTQQDQDDKPSVIFVPPRSHRVVQLAQEDSSDRESLSPSPTPKGQPSTQATQPSPHPQSQSLQQHKMPISVEPVSTTQKQEPPITHEHHPQPSAAPIYQPYVQKPQSQAKPAATFSEEEEEEDSDTAVPLPFYGIKRADAVPLYGGSYSGEPTPQLSPTAPAQEQPLQISPHTNQPQGPPSPRQKQVQQQQHGIPSPRPQPMQQQQQGPPSPQQQPMQQHQHGPLSPQQQPIHQQQQGSPSPRQHPVQQQHGPPAQSPTFIRGPPQQFVGQTSPNLFSPNINSPKIEPFSQPSEPHTYQPVQFHPQQQMQPQSQPNHPQPQFEPHQFPQQPRYREPPQFDPQQQLQRQPQFQPPMNQPQYNTPHFIQPPPEPVFVQPHKIPQNEGQQHPRQQPQQHQSPKKQSEQPQQPLGFAGFTATPRPKPQQSPFAENHMPASKPMQQNQNFPQQPVQWAQPSGSTRQQHPINPAYFPGPGRGQPEFPGSPAPSSNYRTPMSFTPPGQQPQQEFKPVTPMPVKSAPHSHPIQPRAPAGQPQESPRGGPQFNSQNGPQYQQTPLNSYPTTPQNDFHPEGGPMYLSSTDYSEPENEPDEREWRGPTPHWSATLRKRPAPPGKRYPFGTSGNVIRAPPFIPCTNVPEGLTGMKLRQRSGSLPPLSRQSEYPKAAFMDPGTPLAPMAQEYSPAAWKPAPTKPTKLKRDSEVHEDGAIKVASKYAAGGEQKVVLQSGDRGPKIGRWTLAQLKASDGIIPSQYGTNQFASRKGMTDYNSPRDVHGIHYHRLNIEDPDMVGRDEDIALSDLIIPAQCGSNRFASRKGMTEYGAPRDTHGKHFHRLHLEDPNRPNFSEDVLLESDQCVPLLQQSNRYASRKGMTEYGAFRDVRGKHLHRLLEDDATLQNHDEAELRETDLIIPGQYGSNRFASRKGMTEYGAPRDVKGIHYHRLLEEDPSVQHMSDDVLRQGDGIIPGQYGSNKFASRKLMTEYGAFRDVRGPHLHHILTDDPSHFEQFDEDTLRMIDGIIPGQYGTNRFASRKGMTEYGAPRDVKGIHMHRAFEDDPGSFANFNEGQLRSSDAIIPGQYGTNKYDSQKGMTKFGTPRDVRGTHLHRLIDELDLDDFYDAVPEQQPQEVQQ